VLLTVHFSLLTVNIHHTVFVITLRLRKRLSGELATDFTEPVVVSLQPDIHEIKAAMANCVQKIVDASRGFPHPEQSMGQLFGGKPLFPTFLFENMYFITCGGTFHQVIILVKFIYCYCPLY
jgi:hypothetical protein